MYVCMPGVVREQVTAAMLKKRANRLGGGGRGRRLVDGGHVRVRVILCLNHAEWSAGSACILSLVNKACARQKRRRRVPRSRSLDLRLAPQRREFVLL